jgi:NitT/TauT family transport system ATP-binding protein
MALVEQKHPRDSVLQLKEVSKAFAQGRARKHAVLDKLSLNIPEGELVAIVGQSGCGKSTLLNIIAGLDAPDSGSLSARTGKGPSAKAERVVIFQEGALFPWLTAGENVEFGLKAAGVPKERRKEVASHFLEMVQLAQLADSPVHQLSGGMKQRVAIARALALDPQILLMDEPFVALDVQTRELLHEQLLQIHRSTGKTILFVTHNIDEALQLGDRVLVLSSRAGGIKKEMAIDYQKPRDIESPEIGAVRRELLKDLQEEFQLARGHT